VTTALADLFLNPNARRAPGTAGGTAAVRAPDAATRDSLPFHRALPGYAPTPLVDAPAIARMLGLGAVWIKDESSRLGLPSFKILGASWATVRALEARLGDARSDDPAPAGAPVGAAAGTALEALRARVAPLRPLTLVAATDGNHGRAVARMARLLGLDAHIVVPADMVPARREAIAAEGARVSVVAGSYDDAVERAAALADDAHLAVSDTAWPGYEDVPRWVIEGYATIFREIDDERARRGAAGPDVVVVPVGVGALAAAVVRHYRRPGAPARPAIVAVEPARAACVLASLRAGGPVAIPGPHHSIMAGLNCGVPSPVAWPLLVNGVDLAVAVSDDAARRAMRDLAAAGVVAGETGAAALAGITALCEAPDAAPAREALGVGPRARVLLLCTEGATDPAAYARVVGTAAGLRRGATERCSS